MPFYCPISHNFYDDPGKHVKEMKLNYLDVCLHHKIEFMWSEAKAHWLYVRLCTKKENMVIETQFVSLEPQQTIFIVNSQSLTAIDP